MPSAGGCAVPPEALVGSPIPLSSPLVVAAGVAVVGVPVATAAGVVPLPSLELASGVASGVPAGAGDSGSGAGGAGISGSAGGWLGDGVAVLDCVVAGAAGAGALPFPPLAAAVGVADGVADAVADADDVGVELGAVAGRLLVAPGVGVAVWLPVGVGVGVEDDGPAPLLPVVPGGAAPVPVDASLAPVELEAVGCV